MSVWIERLENEIPIPVELLVGSLSANNLAIYPSSPGMGEDKTIPCLLEVLFRIDRGFQKILHAFD